VSNQPRADGDLPRELGLLDATFIIIGIVIGSGIFLLPNLIARRLPSPGAIVSVWIAAGVLSFFGALAYAELGAMIPATGGQYVYVRQAYGDWCAFLCGWVFSLCVTPGGAAFLCVSFSIYVAEFVPLEPWQRACVSLALLGVLAVINYIGVKESAWTQRIFTTAKIGGLFLVIGAAILAPSVRYVGVGPAIPSHVSYSGIGYAMAACLMAYNGWSYISFVAGEVKNPARNLPRALALSMVVVMALYIGANLAYMKVMPVWEIATTERVGAAMAARVMGPHGGQILAAIVLLSITGAVNGNILTGARIPFAQARDGLFLRRFGTIHPRFRTPSFAIAAQTVWTGLLIVTGSYEILSSYTILSAWLFYALGVAAVPLLRRKMPEAPRPYRMWGYPATVYAFLVVSAWFLADAIVNQPVPSLMAFVIAAAGIPFYFVWRKRNVASHNLDQVARWR
jgi:APA family basic amino acid/polyamine antiporter